jgi:hypothetical protein
LWQGANPQANLFLPLNHQPRGSAMKALHKILFIAMTAMFLTTQAKAVL